MGFKGERRIFLPLGPCGTVLDSGAVAPWTHKSRLQQKSEWFTIQLKAQQCTRGQPSVKERFRKTLSASLHRICSQILLKQQTNR